MDCNCNKKKKCDGCGLKECNSPQTNYVRIGYVEGKDTSIGIQSSWGDSDVDLAPIVKRAETDTKLDLDKVQRTIDYYPELYLSSGGHAGCVYSLCLTTIFGLMHLNEIGDVKVPTPHTGETIIYNEETKQWEPYNVVQKIDEINTHLNRIDASISALENRITNVEGRLTNAENSINSISNLIYNYPADKTTKIPRSNINIYSGAGNGPYYIKSRDGYTNNDLRAE